MQDNQVTTKYCHRCNTLKLKTEYNKNRSRSDGLSVYCKSCVYVYVKAWAKNNKDKCRKSHDKWLESHREQFNEHMCKWRKISCAYKKSRAIYNSQTKVRLVEAIRSAVRRTLRGAKNRRNWSELVGYSIGDLKIHLEKHFQPGMTWDNYGEWHIDHKIPVVAFNFDKPEHIDFKRCWALENLQPMWDTDNKRKYAKLSKSFQPMLKLAIGYIKET